MKISSLSCLFLSAALPFLLAGCNDARDDAPIAVSVIGRPENLSGPLVYDATTAFQLRLSATAQGLVAYDASGNIMPALAQRWIVVDDGLSYIFRLRRARWANGDRVEAQDVKRLLERRLRAMRLIDPYGALSSVSDVQAMTNDVLEIHLKSPRPSFLGALAQPLMGIALPTGGTGPYRVERIDKGRGDLWLKPAEPNIDPEDGVGAQGSDRRLLRSERPARAVVRFARGATDMVLGGTLADWPYVSLAEVRPSAIRTDPVQGLFGLALTRDAALMGDEHVREALSMALDRDALVAGVEGAPWKAMLALMPQPLNLPHAPTAPAWALTPVAERRALASGTIARWRAQHGGGAVTVRLALPDGPGMKRLFRLVRAQWRSIGVETTRVAAGERADMTLIDEVAPYDSAAWYLSRLSCARGVHCDPRAEALLEESVTAPTMEARFLLLGKAEPLVAAHNGFIPLATPVRWSLVGGRLDGFQPSARGFHNLRWLQK